MAEHPPPLAVAPVGDPWLSEGIQEGPAPAKTSDPSPAPASQRRGGCAADEIAPPGPPPSPPASQPLAQLPVIDLIGLRFSLQHLRLVGYGLLAVWLSEMVNILASPGVGEIATRLHYISQFLDLSPILLVAIGLIAFQGGLRRGAWEVVLLPLLLTVLPLLCAFHFFLAPVSIANAITLVQKQEQISQDQIRQIDGQINRATSILRESDSIDALLRDLARIPGLEVRLPPDASVTEARLQVRRSLERERDRLRARISSNISDSREAFLRRSIINAVLALLVGLVLWALHRGALREMELSIPFLDWVLVQGEVNQQPEALQDLLRFQRACVALGWFTLLERGVRFLRAAGLPRSSRNVAAQKSQEPPARLSPPPNPFQQRKPGRSAPRSFPPRSALSFLLPSALPLRLDVPPVEEDSEADDGTPHEARAMAFDPAERARKDAPDREPSLRRADEDGPGRSFADLIRRIQDSQQRRDARRRQKDLERYRRHRRRIEREGLDSHAFIGVSPDQDPEDQTSPGEAQGADTVSPSAANPHAPGEASADFSPPPMTRAQWHRLRRDHERAREALQRMAQSEEMQLLVDDPEALEHERLETRDPMTQQPQRPLGLAGRVVRRLGLANVSFWLRNRL